MSDCSHYRRELLAEPRTANPALHAHLAQCPQCARFAAELMSFETRLERALRVTLPAHVRVKPPLYALAASVLLALLVGASLWLTVPARSLAAAVVTHMKGEPDAWRRTGRAVPAPALAAVLEEAHVRLAGAPGVVSYARSCDFRGHQVPHLVLQTPAGPVTVMVLVHERAPRTVQFDEQGYRGVIVPVAGHGSLAVLSQDADADMPSIERTAAAVRGAILWSG